MPTKAPGEPENFMDPKSLAEVRLRGAPHVVKHLGLGFSPSLQPDLLATPEHAVRPTRNLYRQPLAMHFEDCGAPPVACKHVILVASGWRRPAKFLPVVGLDRRLGGKAGEPGTQFQRQRVCLASLNLNVPEMPGRIAHTSLQQDIVSFGFPEHKRKGLARCASPFQLLFAPITPTYRKSSRSSSAPASVSSPGERRRTGASSSRR